jgi:hypothetical protein
MPFINECDTVPSTEQIYSKMSIFFNSICFSKKLKIGSVDLHCLFIIIIMIINRCFEQSLDMLDQPTTFGRRRSRTSLPTVSRPFLPPELSL